MCTKKFLVKFSKVQRESKSLGLSLEDKETGVRDKYEFIIKRVMQYFVIYPSLCRYIVFQYIDIKIMQSDPDTTKTADVWNLQG